MDDLVRLRDSLGTLAEVADRVEPTVPGPDLEARQDRIRDLRWSLRSYLLPRLSDLSAPVVAVLIGSTGAGKSTLLNALAGRTVTEAGAVRPTTRAPVVLTSPEHADRYRRGFLAGLGGDEVDREPQVVVDDATEILRTATLVDAPDVDSIETANAEVAADLLAVADVCVYVTSAQRYADAVPWEVLRGAARRGLPIVAVVNRLPAAEGDRIVADFAARLRAADLPLAGVVRVAEQPHDRVLDRRAVAGLRDRLLALAAPGAREATVLRAVAGALDAALRAATAVAEDLTRERAVVAHLHGLLDEAVADQLARFEAELDDGRLVRAEVLARWEAFVGTGELLAAVTAGFGRLRGWLRRVGGGRPATDRVEAEATSTLAVVIADHADRAAAAAAAAWDRDPVATRLVDGPMWRADPATTDRARRAVEDWLGALVLLVESQGADRHRLARVASAGVNALAVVLALAVFSQTGGLTGAEVGITAGAAAVQQKLLEHVLGSAAARRLVRTARRDLLDRVGTVLAADLRRFRARLPDVATPTDVEVLELGVERISALDLDRLAS